MQSPVQLKASTRLRRSPGLRILRLMLDSSRTKQRPRKTSSASTTFRVGWGWREASPRIILTFVVLPVTPTKKHLFWIRKVNKFRNLQCEVADTKSFSVSFKKTIFLLFVVASILASAGSDVKISCRLPHTIPQSFNLTWRFRRLDPIILISVIDRKSQVKVWDQWKPHVFDNFSVLSALQLHSLKSEHQGTYTCEISTPEEMYITWTDITVTEGNDTTGCRKE